MRNGILAVVALTMGGTALADPPPQQVIEDLNDLRQEIGQTNSTPAEFAQAVRNVVEQRREFSNPFAESFNSNTQTAQAWADDGAPQPSGQPTPSPWSPFSSQPSTPPPGYVVPAENQVPTPVRNYQQPGPPPGPPHGPPHGPPPPHHGFGPPPPPHHAKPGPRPPHVLLQDTAFDLERMAHELDKADLYGEADALRGAANRLRQTARQHKKPGGRPHPPVAERPGPAPVEHPHAAERARRAIQEANERVNKMERQVAEIEAQMGRQAEESGRRMEQIAERARRALQGVNRGRQEAPEGPQRPRERRRERPDRSDLDRPDLPPPGVHGGPTDPPPPPHLAPGQ